MRFSVLGPLEVADESRPVDVGPRRNREVLATLLVHAGDVVSVETLVDEIWGAGAASPGSVHVVVSRLRSRLGDGLIQTRAPGYRLALGDHGVDAHEFENLLRAGRREDDLAQAREHVQLALASWRGDAYADVAVPAVRAEAQRLHQLRLDAHRRLAEIDLKTGHHEEVARRLAVLVEAYPLEEALVAPLMLALYRSGQQAEALATYDRARKLLDDELGIDPTPAVREMHTRILRQDPALMQKPARSEPGHTSAGDGFIGRERELTELRRALGDGLGSTVGPRVAAVVGEAGIGKTWLVEQVAVRAAADGSVVAFGRCMEHEGAPALWPWEQVLDAVAAQASPPTLAAALAGRGHLTRLLLSDTGVDLEPRASDVSSARLYDAVTAFLETVAAERPVLIVLEDMHWADSATTELLDYLATTGRSGRLAVLLSVRHPDTASEGAKQVAAVLSRRGAPPALRLRGLEVDEVRELAAHSLGREVSLATAQALRERTDGNPFYVTELARLYGDERRRTGRGDAPVPSGVQAVIERRLRHLPEGDVDVLVAAAVVGRTVDLSLLGEVTGLGRLPLLETVDRCVTAGILVATDSALAYRFGHALVREALIASAGLSRRSAIHAAVAQSLESRLGAGTDGHVIAALAHHYVAAYPHGDVVKAIDSSLRAASLAQQRLALEEAERLVRLALQLVPAVPGERAVMLEVDLRVRLGTLLTLRHGYNGPGVAEERRRVLSLVGPEGASSDLFSAHWGTWGDALVSGRMAQAEVAVDGLLAAAETTGDAMLRLGGLVARGQTAWQRGRLAAAHRDLGRAARLADAADPDDLDLDLWLQHPGVQARSWLALVLAQQGDLEASAQVAAQAQQQAEASRHQYSISYGHIVDGLRNVMLRRPARALEHGTRALEVARENGFLQLQALALIPLGWGRGLCDDLDEGVAQLTAALDAFRQLPDGYMFGPFMLRLLAELQHRAGRHERALELLERALHESAQTDERFDLVAAHRLRAAMLDVLGRAGADDARRNAAEVAAANGAVLDPSQPI
jgi:DNA-binding SARP family transcriptional activator